MKETGGDKGEKQYRFFYHYYKRFKKMSIHFRGSCMVAQDVICNVPCETKWNKTQPNLVMRGFASSVEIIDDVAIIK